MQLYSIGLCRRSRSSVGRNQALSNQAAYSTWDGANEARSEGRSVWGAEDVEGQEHQMYSDHARVELGSTGRGGTSRMMTVLAPRITRERRRSRKPEDGTTKMTVQPALNERSTENLSYRNARTHGIVVRRPNVCASRSPRVAQA